MFRLSAASRAKLMTQAAVAKMRRTHVSNLYPQPEGTLGEVLSKHGKDLGYDSGFGQACVETGETFQQLAEAKYALEDNVRQNFLEPLRQLETKDLKEISYHRKKTVNRRLDYDAKKRKKEGTVTQEELMAAEEKFEESKNLAETAMFNLLSNDVEQISQLKAFIDGCLDYHRQAADILESLKQTLEDKRCEEQSSKPRQTHVPKRVASTASKTSSDMFDTSDSNGKSGSYSFGQAAPEYAQPTPVSAPPAKATPMCRALYDFEPENEGELAFNEGDQIELVSKIDENWFEGRIRGQTGFFPINYVEVVNPL